MQVLLDSVDLILHMCASARKSYVQGNAVTQLRSLLVCPPTPSLERKDLFFANAISRSPPVRAIFSDSANSVCAVYSMVLHEAEVWTPNPRPPFPRLLLRRPRCPHHLHRRMHGLVLHRCQSLRRSLRPRPNRPRSHRQCRP